MVPKVLIDVSTAIYVPRYQTGENRDRMIHFMIPGDDSNQR